MSLIVNLRHLDAHNLVLEGELPVAQLDIDERNDVIRLDHPVQYKLEIQMLQSGLLVQGRLHACLKCQCVRCLKPFNYRIKLDPWTCLLPLQGEDAVQAVNDCVDLTPWVREDILLEFPQHPLCEPECKGLPGGPVGQSQITSSAGPSEAGGSPAWKALNRLRL